MSLNPFYPQAVALVATDGVRAAELMNSELSCACSDPCSFCQFGYALVEALHSSGLCIGCGRTARLDDGEMCVSCVTDIEKQP